MEWLVLVLAALVWLVDRQKLAARIASLETAVARLRAAAVSPTADHFTTRVVDAAPAPSAAEAQPVKPKGSAPPAGEREPAASAVLKSNPTGSAQAASALSAARQAARPTPQLPPLGGWDSLPITAWLRGYFTGGNVIVRIGILILFFGVAFLLKYATEHSHLPVEARFIGVAILALILLAIGWRLRAQRPAFALALQGGGIGVLYLTVFAALRLYALLPASGAFALLVAIGAFQAILAVRQNSLALALLGATGGFLAPLLTASQTGDHVMLFSYYALLDLGVIAIAWFKAWRPLNLVAFVFTFAVSSIWGATHYQLALLATTEPFLILFFLLFTATAILFAYRRAPDFRYYVDGTLVFGTPAMVMGLQAGLVREIPYAMAFSALALSAFYLALGWLLVGRRRDSLRLLIEAYLALGVAFATLAIPLALEGRWTATCWALEGTAVFWFGLRQQRRLAVAAGVLLQFAAGVAYVTHESGLGALRPLANSHFMAAVIVSIGGLATAALARHGEAMLRTWRAALSAILLYWGLAWWLFAWLAEVDRFVPSVYQPAAALCCIAISAAWLSLLADLLNWSAAKLPPLALFPWLILTALLWGGHHHPAAAGGWWAWPIGTFIAYATLKRHESIVSAAWRRALHVASLWLLSALVTWECAWQVQQVTGGAWALATWGAVPALLLLCLPALSRQSFWPFAKHRDSYTSAGAFGIAVYLCVWLLATNLLSDGDASPLPYVPLLSPLDAAGGVGLIAIANWLLRLPPLAGADWLVTNRRAWFGIAAAVTFCWLSTMLLRSVHHFGGIRYEFTPMMESTLTQSSLSIFWTVMALAAMLWSARHGHRLPWFCGAVLMGIVVVKLFAVDLSHIGTVPRIVSFLGVGTLMLVLGYFSPLPPNKPEPST